MEIKKKIENVEGEVLILNGDIYSFDSSKNDGENREFCKNGEVIHRLPFEAFYLSGDSIYLSYSYEKACYVYKDSKLELISNEWCLRNLFGKYATISYEGEGNSPYKVIELSSLKVLDEIEVFHLFFEGKIRMLLFAHEDLLFYWRNKHSFEICNLQDEILLKYDVSILDEYFRDSIASKSSEGDRLANIDCCTVVGNRLLLRTKKGRLVCFDLTTFQELWKIDGFKIKRPPSSNHSSEFYHLPISNFKVDFSRNVLYCFHQKIYWELSIDTGELVYINNLADASKAFHYNDVIFHFEVLNDNIYFPIDEISDSVDGRLAWPRFMAINKFTGEIVDQLEFKKKSTRKKRLYSFNGLQFIDGVFYLFASGDCFLIEP